MCGIIGYVGTRQASPILIQGLHKLEYRGYDSAGIAVIDRETGSRTVRCRGKLANLEARLATEPVTGTIGIGHTRWATHGKPSDENSHPHKAGAISVIHNGIIENHVALRQELVAAGRRFASETDTEIFAHLVDRELAQAGTLALAVRRALHKIRGSYAFVVMSDHDPDTLVAAKSGSPLVVGIGDGEMVVASDVTAILAMTRKVVFLEDGDLVTVTRSGMTIEDFEGAPRQREPKVITWSAMQAEKSGYKHFMLKEIHEQPRAVAETMVGRIDHANDDAYLDGIELDTGAIRRIVFVACGTSYHASLVGEFMIEALARIPVEVELASEFRYRDPIVGPGDLVVAVSQSGETLDTMEAVREAKRKGATILAISNVIESSIPRLADHAFYTHAGPEIGVASTKAFTTQLVAIVLLAIHLGRRTNTLSRAQAHEILAELTQLPTKLSHVVGLDAHFQVLARRYGKANSFLFLGRGAQYPIALEGALKLKEISYIHADGYAAGEMKHGPIALVDDTLPVIVLAPRGPSYEKTIANLAEVRARQGRVLAIATRGDQDIGYQADDVVLVPETVPVLQPILTVLPLQLLSYYVADLRGTDVDQPRNLAKSVTVE